MAVLGSTHKPDTTVSTRTGLGVDLAEGWQVTRIGRRSRGSVVFPGPADPARAPDLPVSVALPVFMTFMRRLRAPFASVAKAEKVWPSLLDIELPFPLEQAEYRFLHPARTADGQVETLAVAVRRDDLVAWHQRVQQAGFMPWVVDHEGLALWSRSLAEQPLEKQGHRLVCYVGLDRVALVWGRGTELLAASGLRSGARELFDPVRGEAARRQWVQRAGPFLRAQAGSAGPSFQWAWCGPGATRPDQLRLLAEELKLPDGVTFFTHREPDSFLARAVAARMVQPGANACSFLPGDLAPPACRDHQRARARRPALALAAAALLLIGLNLGWATWLHGRRDHLQGLLQHQALTLSGLPSVPRGQEVLLTERALKEQAPSYIPFADALAPSLLLDLRELLQQASALDLRLERVTLGKRAMLCSGTAVDQVHPENLARDLAPFGWITELQHQDTGADGRPSFTLKASR